MIKVRYSSIDRFSKTGTFKTLAGARKFAAKWVGEHPEIGSRYAVSGDGIGKVTVEGATLAELFPEPVDPRDAVHEAHNRAEATAEAAARAAFYKDTDPGEAWRDRYAYNGGEPGEP